MVQENFCSMATQRLSRQNSGQCDSILRAVPPLAHRCSPRAGALSIQSVSLSSLLRKRATGFSNHNQDANTTLSGEDCYVYCHGHACYAENQALPDENVRSEESALRPLLLSVVDRTTRRSFPLPDYLRCQNFSCFSTVQTECRDRLWYSPGPPSGSQHWRTIPVV